MNAWRQPVVQGLMMAVILLALCLAWLLTGVGSQPQWPAPAPAHAGVTAADPAELPPVIPLAQVANTWQTPLFSPGREPDHAQQAVKANPDLSGLRLTGVVIDATIRRALFKQADGREVSLREGGQLANGWRLQRVDTQAVQLELNGQTRRLQLPSPRLPNMPVASPASSILLDRPAPLPLAPEAH